MANMPNNDNNKNSINLLTNLTQRVANFESIFHAQSVLFARELQHFLEADNRIPHGCRLIPYNGPSLRDHGRNYGHYVLVEFEHQRVNDMVGSIVLELPVPYGSIVHMRCSINQYNGCFLRRTVDSIEAMYEVMEFCYQVMQAQPEPRPDDDYGLDYLRIPEGLSPLFQLFVSEEWREENARFMAEEN